MRQETADWGEPRSKTTVWHDPMITAKAATVMSGLDCLRAVRDGQLPPPPIAELLGFRIVEIEPGMVVFESEPDESVYNPIGVVHGGFACALTDTVVGCSVHSSLDAGVAYTSIDLNVTYLRPITSSSGVLRATGQLVKPGRRVAYATAEITDRAGKLVAAATSSFLIMDNR